jgi:large subunit ribosomal protein L5
MPDNKMREIKVNKLVINIGTGSDESVQGNAKQLIKMITGRKPADEVSRTRNPAFKIAKGQKIGAFVTVRGEDAKKLIKKLLEAVDNRIKYSSITENSMSFGIPEYIDISGVKYDPKIGMLGMNVNISFKRNGLRVAFRKRQNGKIPAKHRSISREEIQEYIKREFGVTTTEAG